MSATVRILLALALLVGAAPAGADVESARAGRGARSIGAVPPGESVDELVRLGLAQNASGELTAAEATFAKLRELHPYHPAGHVYVLDSLFWRRNLDFTDTTHDGAIRLHAERTVELGERWLASSPDDATAHVYCGQALLALMRLDGMQGHYFKAGKQGEQARKHLERALEIDPELHDAKLPLGSYYYYASIATRYIRWFSWLWFVPTGERDLGIQYVTEAATEGDYRRFEATATLARIYLYMEDDPKRAAPIIEALADLHPENTYLQFERIEVRMILRDYRGTLEAARVLEQSSSSQFGAEERRQAARTWRARAKLHLGMMDEASRTLAPLEQGLEAKSRWNKRWILLTRGHLHDLAGRRKQAVDHYERVIALKSRWGGSRPIKLAVLGLEEPFQLSDAPLTQ